MNLSTITLEKALEIIDSGKLFSIEYVTCDRNRGTGGQLKAFTEVSKYINPDRTPSDTAASGRSVKKKKTHKNKINIWVPKEPDSSKRIKTVHIRLITMINGQEVL